MSSNTLLAHLATKLSPQQELIATEALHYILTSSKVAQQAFWEYASSVNVELPKELFWHTQKAVGDSAIPDLVATYLAEGKVRRNGIVLEAKFWAGLTDSQPVSYLKSTDGILLFLAPAKRLRTLWPELLNRCRRADMAIQAVQEDNEPYSATVDGRVMALGSWPKVLTHLITRLELSGELAVAADARQLLGLCQRMDAEAFLPVQSEELSAHIGRRLYQYCDLVDDLTIYLESKSIANLKGLNAAAVKGRYGRYMKIEGRQCRLSFNYQLWGTKRETPLWFRVWNSENAEQHLHPLIIQEPPGVIKKGKQLMIPLSIPTGVERDEVVRDLLAQIMRVVDLLRQPTPSATTEADCVAELSPPTDEHPTNGTVRGEETAALADV